jgi:hypothetical protein
MALKNEKDKKPALGSFSLLSVFRGVEAEAGEALLAELRELLGERAVAEGREALARAEREAASEREAVAEKERALIAELRETVSGLWENDRRWLARVARMPAARERLGLDADIESGGEPGDTGDDTPARVEAARKWIRAERLGDLLQRPGAQTVAAGLALARLPEAERAAAGALVAALPRAMGSRRVAEALSRASFLPLGADAALRPSQGAAALVEREAGAKGLALRTGAALGVLDARGARTEAEREAQERWGFSPSADDEAGSFLSEDFFAPDQEGRGGGEGVDTKAARRAAQGAAAIALGVSAPIAQRWGALIAGGKKEDERAAAREKNDGGPQSAQSEAPADTAARQWARLLDKAVDGLSDLRMEKSVFGAMSLRFGPSHDLSEEALGAFAEEAALRKEAARVEGIGEAGWIQWAGDWIGALADAPLLGELTHAFSRARMPEEAKNGAEISMGGRGRRLRFGDDTAEKELDAAALAWHEPCRPALEAAQGAFATVAGLAAGAGGLSLKEAATEAAKGAQKTASEAAAAWAEQSLGDSWRAQKLAFGERATVRETAWCARNPAALIEAAETSGAHGRAAARWGMALGVDPARANGGNHLCALAREAWVAQGGSALSWKLLASLPEGALARLDAFARAKASEEHLTRAFFLSVKALGVAAEAGVDPEAASRWMHAVGKAPEVGAPTGSALHKAAPEGHLGALEAIAPDAAESSALMGFGGNLFLESDEPPVTEPWQGRFIQDASRLAAMTGKRREPERGENPTQEEARAIEADFEEMQKRASRVLRAALSRADAVGALKGSAEAAGEGGGLFAWLRVPGRLERMLGVEAPAPTPEATPEALDAERAEARRRATIQRFETELGEVHDWLLRSEVGVWATLPMKPEWPLLARRAKEWHELVQAEENAEHDAKQWDPLFGEQADGEFKAIELTSGRELREEGRAMHHCVSTYAGDCHDGKCRIFSIQWLGERHSTLELRFDEEKKAWAPGQNLGVCNSRTVNAKARELGEKLARKATELGLRPQRTREAEALGPGEPPQTEPEAAQGRQQPLPQGDLGGVVARAAAARAQRQGEPGDAGAPGMEQQGPRAGA